jgi:hypothetical protein
MSNKKKLEEQAENLQKELNKLKEEIKKCDEIDLFSITTYKEVYKVLGEKELTLCDFKEFPEKLSKKLLATARIEQLERLYNQNWVKNYNDKNQYKYRPYFEFASNNWRFSCSIAYCWSGCSVVGVFKDEKTSSYVGKTFLNEIFVDILNN